MLGYLNDMVCSGRGCDVGESLGTSCLSSSPGTSHLRCTVRVFATFVHSAMLHNCETWEPNTSDLQRLYRIDSAMIHWIHGTKDGDKTPSASLLQKLRIEDIITLLHVTAQVVWPCTTCIVLNQTCHMLSDSLEGEEDLERRGSNVWIMMSENVACLSLTLMTETHGGPMFDVAWCFPPN